jgi:branched-chain amino acid transport system ATP-binding protein
MSVLLEMSGVQAAYGTSQVLFGIDLTMSRGEAITLIGRNGMGKSSTVKSIMGQLKPSAGVINFLGREVTGARPHYMAKLGIGLVPEGRQIFPTLSVRENLVATARPDSSGQAPWTLETVYSLFPRLKERRNQLGASLSGGEQQMLAIGRALMTNPLLLILDEATEGLAPLVRHEIWNCLEGLKKAGLSMIVIDKNLDALLSLADRHYVMEKGRVAWTGDSAQFGSQRDSLMPVIGV